MTETVAEALESNLSIELPAEREQVGTARIFAAAVARHFGCDPGDVEDLKIALSEVCGLAITRPNTSIEEPLRLEVSVSDGAVTFAVHGPTRVPEGPGTDAGGAAQTEEQMLALSVELITALFPDAELADSPERTVCRLSVPRNA